MFNMHQQNVSDLALEKLERKYGEKFEFQQMCGNSMTGTRNFIASCSEHGRILVQIDNFRDEEARVFRDNHIAVKYENETRNYIKDTIEKQFKESRVLYTAAQKALSEDIPADATFEEYLAESEAYISASAAVKSSDYSDNGQLKKVGEVLIRSFFADRINISVYVLESDEYDSFDPNTQSDIELSGKYVKRAYIHRENGTTEIVISSCGGVADERQDY